MTEDVRGSTQQGEPAGGEVDQNVNTDQPVQVLAAPEPTERELEMERIANRELLKRGGAVDASQGEARSAAPADEPKKEEPKLDVSSQLGQQLEDGTLVLDESMLSRAVVRTKIDGKEELVPASKALAQYQKNGAADVRLAEATRLARENADLQKQLTEKAAAITAPQPQKTPEQDVADTEELVRLQTEHAEALYGGDNEKAGKLFDQMINVKLKAVLASREPAAPQLTAEEIAQQAVPALKQQLAIDGALEKLFTDYPEIKSDPDYTMLADMRRAAHEAQGKTRAEAIALAGEELGEKYGLGKHSKKDVARQADLTTRDQKLAAKERLDEPTAAAARAVNSMAQLPQTASQVIAEMASQRGQRAA